MKLNSGERLDDLQFKNLQIIQNKHLYCFSSDAVALANFVRVPTGGKVADLCSGSGVIGILVSAKNNVSKTVLVELQHPLAEMSARSVALNGLENFEVVCDRLQNIHKKIGGEIYDVVTCNPPYKKRDSTALLCSTDTLSIARHEIEVTLEEIIIESEKLLKFGGYLYICQKEERLTDILCLSRKHNLEPKEIKILLSEKGAATVLVKCKKGGKSGIKILL